MSVSGFPLEGRVGVDPAEFMALALRIARRGTPAPNPHVGAVVVQGRDIVGFGHHERAGGPHAEVSALERAGSRARGATLYVTLEPCNHYGRTPPCSDAIVRAGIGRVVFGCKDPNPTVLGGGARRLREAGIEVIEGVSYADALRLIAPWLASLQERAAREAFIRDGSNVERIPAGVPEMGSYWDRFLASPRRSYSLSGSGLGYSGAAKLACSARAARLGSKSRT